MKKKLEAELISIAHRILKLKNKSEVDQLLAETQQLYEKLSVLKFVEENFAGIKPTIGRDAAVEILETAFDDKEDALVAGKPKADKKEQPEKGKKSEAEKPAMEPAAEAAPEAQEEDLADPVKEEIPAGQEEVKAQTEETVEAASEKMEEAGKTPETSDAGGDGEANHEHSETVQSESEPEKDGHGIIEPNKPETVTDAGAVIDAGMAFEQPEAVKEADTAKTDEFFKPAFEWAFEPKTEEKAEDNTVEATKAEEKSPQSAIAFEDLLGAGYKDPVFVKPGEVETEAPAEDNRIEPATEAKKDVISISRFEDKVPVYKMGGNSGAISLNDRVSKGITVGLNDRIAFVKNLFNNSNEEYNRVLSQLLTFDTFDQARDFIDNMVKPDYGNWEGRDEYAQRFMEVVERKFS